uniref:Uncharacterized protein n=1 Tax=Cacopsylla melanoneura TaxID=428564 RepID=A0A8D9BH36_9HEMI
MERFLEYRINGTFLSVSNKWSVSLTVSVVYKEKIFFLYSCMSLLFPSYLTFLFRRKSFFLFLLFTILFSKNKKKSYTYILVTCFLFLRFHYYHIFESKLQGN